MRYRTLEEVCHSRETDVWMGANIHAISGLEFCGTEMVEEDDWANHALLVKGQDTADLEPVTQILFAAFNDQIDCITRHVRLP